METKNLSRISKDLRYQICVDKKVFISLNAVACPIHINEQSWSNVREYFYENEEFDFTKNHIQDMFQLLTNPPLKSGPKASRMCFSSI